MIRSREPRRHRGVLSGSPWGRALAYAVAATVWLSLLSVVRREASWTGLELVSGGLLVLATAGLIYRLSVERTGGGATLDPLPPSDPPAATASEAILDQVNAAPERRARRQLEQSEALWRSVIEQSIVGILVLKGEQVTYANARALAILGFTLEELRALASVRHLVHPDDLKRAEERIGALRGTSDLPRDGDAEHAEHVEFRCIRRDGRVIYIELFGSVFQEPGTGERMLVATILDVSERVRATRTLHESERWFRSLIEEASEMIAVLDLDARFMYVSPAVQRMFEWEQSEMLGRTAFEFLHEEDHEKAREELQSVLGQESPTVRVVLRFRHRGGEWRLLDLVGRGSIAPTGEQIVIINARDITESVLLEQQYEDAERLASLGRVAAAMAHEFNNVLMSIQPFVHLLERDDASATASTAAKQISSAVARGRSVTHQILRITRGEEPRVQPLAVGRLLEQIEPELRALFPPEVELTLSSPPDLWIEADPEQFQQILINMGLNAREAMPQGGAFDITASECSGETRYDFGVLPDAGKYVHFIVSDTGVGMPPEVSKRAFEPMFTTRGRVGGTGLGLAVSKQIVLAHGGALFLESAPGAGTRFHLFLPCAQAPAEGRESREAHQTSRPAGVVLLIEDDDLVASGLMALLESEEMQVERAATGNEGIESVKQRRPAVIILDFGLPDMSGAEVLEQLDQIAPDVPVVMATGHAGAGEISGSLERRRIPVLQKPFELDALLAAIDEVTRAG